jgi:replicative superfamily II helicase
MELLPRRTVLSRISDLSALGLDQEFLARLAAMVLATPEQSLTQFQSATLADSAIDSRDGNLLVTGPTSAGKTVVASVLAALSRKAKPNNKIIYVVPLRALVAENRTNGPASFRPQEFCR